MELMEEEAAGGGCLVFRGCHLPPGFRFQPTDQEIIVYYLKKKIAATAASITSIIADVDIYKFDPWDLPGKAMFGEGEWFFFSPRDRKYPNGARPNRTAGSGYWKATGTDKPILAGGGAHCLGVKKALVFYQGRSPKGTKTEWVMHEYRLLETDAALAVRVRARPPNDSHSMRLDDWVLCRVRNKNLLQAGAGASDSDPAPTATTRADGMAVVATATAAAHSRPHPEPEVPDDDAGFHHQFAGIDWNWNNDDGQGQLLHYLITGGPLQEPAASASVGGSAAAHLPLPGDPAAPHRTLVSVLESIKRNLSFQAIDELYLLQPPSKRVNCLPRGTAADHEDEQHMMSPTSFSISDTDDVF